MALTQSWVAGELWLCSWGTLKRARSGSWQASGRTWTAPQRQQDRQQPWCSLSCWPAWKTVTAQNLLWSRLSRPPGGGQGLGPHPLLGRRPFPYWVGPGCRAADEWPGHSSVVTGAPGFPGKESRARITGPGELGLGPRASICSQAPVGVCAATAPDGPGDLLGTRQVLCALEGPLRPSPEDDTGWLSLL